MKKESIPTPTIEVVKRITERKPFAVVPSNYIRIKPELNLPDPNVYELLELDYIFLEAYQNKFMLDGETVLTEEFLRDAITDLEKKAGKEKNIPRNKSRMMAFIEKERKNLSGYQKLEALTDCVYNYWRNRREELRFPLLRTLWRPSENENSHFLAFKARGKDQRNLRKLNRINEEEIIHELYEEFDIACKLADRVCVREELKFRNIQAQIHSIDFECRNVFGSMPFLEGITEDTRFDDKEKLRTLHSSY